MFAIHACFSQPLIHCKFFCLGTDLASADNDYEMGARRMTASRGVMPTTPAAE